MEKKDICGYLFYLMKLLRVYLNLMECGIVKKVICFVEQSLVSNSNTRLSVTLFRSVTPSCLLCVYVLWSYIGDRIIQKELCMKIKLLTVSIMSSKG